MPWRLTHPWLPAWLALLAAFAGEGRGAEPLERELPATLEGEPFADVLILPGAAPAPLPVLLTVPNWMGIRADNLERARALAARGYAVLLADVFGVRGRPRDRAEAQAATRALYAQPGRIRARLRQALERIPELAGEGLPLDPARVAAVGFCFGGAAVLELARDGAPIAAAVAFHARLATAEPATRRPEASILVLNGADDPLVPAEQLRAFEEEMRAVGADWTAVQLGGAVHCFAEPGAEGGEACRHDPRAASRAFAIMELFLRERFAAP